jgi:REP element-mobilizing transposase RayT
MPWELRDLGMKHDRHAAEPNIHRGYSALRRGRRSLSGTDYFITGCLKRPLSGLTDATLAALVQAQLHGLESRGLWHVRTSTLMPDHFHLLVTLDVRSSLAEAVRLLKGPLSPVLRMRGLCWQKKFYDHRLRSEDDLLTTFLYIFLNPYRAGLIKTGQKWTWYQCAAEDWEWFGGMTNEAQPFPEWLR